MKNVSLRLDTNLLNYIDEVYEGNSISDKIRECVCSNLYHRKYLEKQKLELEHRLEFINKKLEENIFETKQLSEAEKTMLLETIELLKTRPEILVPRHNLYNGEFNKKITMSDFKLLMYELKEGKI